MEVHSISDIFFACTEKKEFNNEHFIPEHILTHIYTGEMLVTEGNSTHRFKAGETAFFKRNQLAKFTKLPAEDGPCTSVTIFFGQAFLQEYFSKNTAQKQPIYQNAVMRIPPHSLLTALFSSIQPYYSINEGLPKGLIEIKMVEAITILRGIHPEADSILTDFAEPGKIDLAEFMGKHYSYNLTLDKFAYLTGRSLATFKRDFQKVFGIPPQKWLQKKRLEEAHYLIAQKKQKPTEVYLQVGFENLSHFSFAFKQMFGYTPTAAA